MKSEESELLAEVTPKLNLIDIRLQTCSLTRPEDYTTEGIPELGQQSKRAVEYVVDKITVNDEEKLLLKILVQFATRLVEKERSQVEEKDLVVIAEIQADYLVIYEICGEATEDQLSVFARFNAVHNSWPFLRQHVFDQVGRSKLPEISLPLFSR